MRKSNLPTYAIVELLIRLEPLDPSIGNYKDHSFSTNEVMVKTQQGTIRFSNPLVQQQFEAPELINNEQLLLAAASFRPFR
ncbi:hypothetical protein [Mucilaginibacter sp.]|uniref:hypothetical protein n=1 Tax=Mucilaginibacter sp. TaxID=1882438 RepID=UPI003D0A4A28